MVDQRYDGAWPAIRRRARESFGPEPVCVRCGEVIVGPVDVDHLVPNALGGDHSLLGPAHPSCNRSHGARLGVALRRAAAHGLELTPPAAPSSGPVGLGGPAADVWAVGWLDGLRDVPADATWPRLMTAPHPLAVGTLGAEFVAWSRARSGRPLRWWQILVAYRLLEVDRAGRLVWEALLLSVARQSGKSWFLRELCLWRLKQTDRFGEDQLVIHTAKDVTIAKEVQRPARVWARAHADEFKVREVNGDVGIEELATGSRWVIRASDGVYGYSATMATVDEAWSVDEAHVADGLEPTMLEKEQPQLLLVSTAHRRATRLMLGRRADAVAQLDDPARTLLMEWSAPGDAAADDEGAWRLASPHWTERRRAMVADMCRRAGEGVSPDPTEPDPVEGFRCQYLNVWPTTTAEARSHGPLLEPGCWFGLEDDQAGDDLEAGVWVAVEDNYGHGCAAAAVVHTDDERLAVWGRTFATRAEAAEWVAETAGGVAGATLIVGATLVALPMWDDLDLPRVAAGRSETGPALALVRDLVANRRVIHDGGAELAEQIESLRVAGSPGGVLTPLRHSRFDLVKAAAWCLAAAATEAGPGRMFTDDDRMANAGT